MASATSEWQRTYRYMMNTYRGTKIPPVEEFWYDWNAPDEFTTHEDRVWIWTEGVRLGLFLQGHVTTGALVGLGALSAAGHELCIVTHRPKQAVSDTLAWVSLHFKIIPLSGFHILTNEEPKSSVDADILIDDKLSNCDDWASTGRNAILFHRPWNNAPWLTRTYPYQDNMTLRCADWESVVNTIGHLSNI